MADTNIDFSNPEFGVDTTNQFSETGNNLTSNTNPNNGNNNAPQSLRYPLKKISEADDYLEVRVVKYQAPGIDISTNLELKSSTDVLRASGNIEKPLAYIYLPMPKELSDTNSVGWGEDSLNSAAAFGAKQIANVLQSSNLVSGGIDALKNAATALEQLATSGVGQQAVVSQFTSSLVNSLGANTTPEGILSRATGQVLNPHMELLFKSVTLRSFSFTFDFAPRDNKESKVIKQIIRTFKKSMAPKSGGVGPAGGGVFISSPDVFQLTFKTGKNKHPFLNSFKPMALTNMSINYTGSGAYATYDDATPVHMQLTVQFQELNPIYNEDYENSDIGVGY